MIVTYDIVMNLSVRRYRGTDLAQQYCCVVIIVILTNQLHACTVCHLKREECWKTLTSDGKIGTSGRPIYGSTAGKVAVDSRQPAADTCRTAAVTGIFPSPPSAGFIVRCGDRHNR